MSFKLGRRQFLSATVASITLVGSASLSRLAFAAKPAVYTPRFSNLALSGYDPVAYFTSEKAKKGAKSISLDYQGVEWRFVSETNKQAFESDPDQYAPQFGGYCAFSVAQGKLVKGDPTLWAIENERLYVNYNKGIHRLWLGRKDKLINEALENWPSILSS